jgi:hypothetical protein
LADSRIRRDTPISGTHLTEPELRKYWIEDIRRAFPKMAERIENNDVNFPRSRKDLIALYTAQDIANFKLESE